MNSTQTVKYDILPECNALLKEKDAFTKSVGGFRELFVLNCFL